MILVCGEALIDMVPQEIKSQTHEQRNGFYPAPGGSPYNTAIAVGRLGVPVQFLGRLSRDFFGEILVKRLLDNNVGTDYIIRSDENTTLAFVKLENGKEPEYIFYTEGTADRSLVMENLPPILPADTYCIAFGSIAMTMEPVASSIESLVFDAVRQVDAAPVISFDPNIRHFMIPDRDRYLKRFEKWIAVSTIVKISAVDFEFIYPELSLNNALQKTLDMGPRLVLTTLGPDGAVGWLRRNDGSILRISAPVINLPVVDTIGAGDTFHGAFLAYLEIHGKMSPSLIPLLSEKELYDTLFFANKAASIVCSRNGAEPPVMAEVKCL
jgi:fructokinase